ncbi:MAG: hypothetical protein PHH16_03695 [Candidatus Gracilibacteria bacterium]|nr:hypothetical protein [Candidatus Gracilibacteria bacterium]
MKRIIHPLIVVLFVFFSFSPAFADCSSMAIENGGSVQSALDGCKPGGSIASSDGYAIDKGVKAKVVKITNQLILAGSILSVGGIVFAAILYVTALGDGEKVKKAKTALKFSVVGFVLMLLSFPIVNALVNMIYGIGK